MHVTHKTVGVKGARGERRASIGIRIGICHALMLGSLSCHGGDTSAVDAASDTTAQAIDLCDAFSGVDTSCPIASPLRCFALCEASGCFCRATPSGPRWDCVIDLSCQPDCGPLDDGCAPSAASDDGSGDASSEPSE
jgi:hypothetical protein